MACVMIRRGFFRNERKYTFDQLKHFCNKDEMDFDRIVTHYQQLIHPKNHSNNDDLTPWNWVCSSLINLLEKYASGATESIIISDLQSLWDDTPDDWTETSTTRVTGLNALGETQTSGVLEVKVENKRRIGGTHVWAITVEDAINVKMDHYLHPQFTEIVDGPCPLLIPGRTIRMVGARASTMGSPPRPVLLPTPYLSVVLGTINGVLDDHLTDSFETTPLSDLSLFCGKPAGECVIAAKVVNIRDNCISLCDHSVPPPNYVELQLPKAHIQVIQLVRKGEVLRIFPLVPKTFDPNKPIIEYSPGSIICVKTSPPGASVESLLDGPGIRSMHHSKNRMRIGDIHAGMSGINLVARVVSKGHNKPTTNTKYRYPLQLCDIPSHGYVPQTLDVTLWDNPFQLRYLRPGMLIYAENLYALPVKDNNNRNFYVVASAQNYNSRLISISSLPGLISSSLFPTTTLSSILPLTLSLVPYPHLPSNFIVRATILEYTKTSSDLYVFTAHTPCMRVTNKMDPLTQVWTCSFCNTSAHESVKGEWEKVIVIQWKIGDGSAECFAAASPRVQEVILQMRASSFAELDKVQQRARITAAFYSSYLFSLSIGVEGQKRVMRIDQLVAPNPVVEAQRLIDDLSNQFP